MFKRHHQKMQILFEVPTLRKRSFFVTILSSVPLAHTARERDGTRMQLRTLTVCFYSDVALRMIRTLFR